MLGISGSLRAEIVAADAIALLLLHSRVLVAARHRLAAIVPAVIGVAVLLAASGLRADARHWMAILAIVVVAAALLFAAERSLPGRKLLPTGAGLATCCRRSRRPRCSRSRCGC